MHGTLQDCEEMDVILSDEKREERESATVAVVLVEGEYEKRLTMMEQHFEIESTSRELAVSVTPRVVVDPGCYVWNGERIHKRGAQVWQPEDAGQSLFLCVAGTESETSIQRQRYALVRFVE